MHLWLCVLVFYDLYVCCVSVVCMCVLYLFLTVFVDRRLVWRCVWASKVSFTSVLLAFSCVHICKSAVCICVRWCCIVCRCLCGSVVL